MIRIAPSSAEAALWFATDALATNRFSVAIEALHRLGPNRGWLDDGFVLRQIDLDAHHYAGDFEGELREARSDWGHALTGYRGCFAGVRPLAAMGQESAVDSLIVQCLALPDAPVPGSPSVTAAVEFHAHGHRTAELRSWDRARRWYGAQQPPWTSAFVVIDWYAGNWKAVMDYWRLEITNGQADARMYGQIGASAAHLGDRVTALDMMRQLEKHSGNATAWRAMIALALGDRENALQLLRDAVAQGVRPAAFFHAQPGLDPLRGHPPFDAMLRPRR